VKLLLLTHNYPLFYGDMRGKFLLSLVKGLVEQGVDVVVSTPFWISEAANRECIDSFSGETIIRFPWAGNRFQSMSPVNPVHILSFLKFCKTWSQSLSTIVKKEKFDLIIAAWAIPAGILLYNKNIKGVFKGVWLLGTDYHRFMKYPFKPIIINILKKGNQVWSNSKRVVSELQTTRPGLNVFFMPDKTKKWEQFQSSSPVNDKKNIRLLSIGRLENVKGFDMAIKACRSLIDKGIPVEYEIIGEGSRRSELESLISGYGQHIKLAGKIEDDDILLEYLQRCHALVIPSRYEGMPSVFFEALEAGKPVIATDVGDMKVCLRGNSTGKVTAVEDIDGLAESIHMLAEGKVHFDQQRADELFAEYSVDRSVDLLLSILKNKKTEIL